MFLRRLHQSAATVMAFLTLGFANPGYAQDTTNTIGQVAIASPTAASLGKFGDIPVSYHTGIPNISIPVYTIAAGSLKLPIGLSYHASGLKVQEPAGWVGAGWALNAGGVITRTVVGAADDRGNNAGASSVLYGYYSDFGFQSYLNAVGDTTPDDQGFGQGKKDGEPDLYFYNFGGYTGKFYFNDDRTPILMPDQDLRIQPFLQVGPGFLGFIVTTPDGIKYYFGKTGNNAAVDPLEITTVSTAQNGYSTANDATSSWFLNKVVSADGMDSITLSYQAENYSYYTIASSPVLSSVYSPYSPDYTYSGLNVVKNFVAGVRLTQINFPNGQVNFTPSASARTDLSGGSSASVLFYDVANTNAYSLGSISITDNQGFCKKDSFYYSYFYDNTSLPSYLSTNFGSYNLQTDEYRLRLDSLQQTSCDGSTKVPPYKFTYFTEKVPRRLSFGVDHWGYANGADGNPILVPSYTLTGSSITTISGANRDAVWPAMRGGALQQITYPTGGYTSFAFGPKATYTFTGTVLSYNFLNLLVDRKFGQSQWTDTCKFSVQDNGIKTSLEVTYGANYAGTLYIWDSATGSGTKVYQNTNVYSSFNDSLLLPGGTYYASLTLPNFPNDTGGAEVTFHQFQYLPTSTVLLAGGLRINAITTSDGFSANNIVTSYDYLDNSSFTNDILYSIPVYVQTIRNDALMLAWPYASPNGCASADNFGGHTYFVSGGSLRPMATAQGENVGYNEVHTSQVGNGNSIYRYYGSNMFNNAGFTDVCVRTVVQSPTCDASIPNFPSVPVPFEPMRDELQYEGHFDQAGHLLKESYYYPVYVQDSLTTPGHISFNGKGLYSYTEYNLQSARKTQDKAVTAEYDPAHHSILTTTKTTYNGSPYHLQPTRQVVSTSTGDSLINRTSYVMDLRVPGCDAVPDSLPYYMTTVQNNTSWMLNAVGTCTPQVDNTTNCRAINFYEYRQMQMRARLQFIRYRRRSFAADSSNLVSSCYLTAMAAADTILKPILRLQNAYVNTPIETSQWRDSRLLHANFTQYDTSQSPLGFAYPGKTQLINLPAPSGSFTPAAVSGSSLTRDSRYLDESLYLFSTGNPRQVTPHSGVTSSYIWDYQNKEPIAKVTNATVDQIAYTSFEADGNGTWSIPNNGRDSYSITGSQSYNLGNGAVSRSGLNSSSTYIVSYWSKTGSPYSVTGSASYVQGKTINSFTYYEHTVTGVSAVTISGGGDIDELRLYPNGAQMTTYTYRPVVGMSGQCDVDNRVTYYFYDPLGRLHHVSDQDGNIVKTYQYHYKGQ